MPIRHPKGDRSPSLTDTITVDGAAFDLTSSTVKFQMRGVGLDTLEVDTAATIVTPAAGTVRYDWAAGDVDTEGDYLGWWLVTLPSGRTQRTPEFLVQITPPLGRQSMLCEVGEVRDHLQKSDSDRGQDNLIETMIVRASRVIESYCDREFTPTEAATRRFPVRGRWVDLAPYDLRAVDEMTLHPEGDGTVLTANTDYILQPIVSTTGTYTRVELFHGVSYASSYQARFGHALLDIEGDWGFAATPADVRLACVVAVSNWMRQGPQAFTVQFNPDGEVLERPEALSSAVRRLLDPYRRWS